MGRPLHMAGRRSRNFGRAWVPVAQPPDRAPNGALRQSMEREPWQPRGRRWRAVALPSFQQASPAAARAQVHDPDPTCAHSNDPRSSASFELVECACWAWASAQCGRSGTPRPAHSSAQYTAVAAWGQMEGQSWREALSAKDTAARRSHRVEGLSIRTLGGPAADTARGRACGRSLHLLPRAQSPH